MLVQQELEISMIIETKEKNFNDLKNLLLIVWIGDFVHVVFYVYINHLWKFGLGKRYMLSQSAVICFVYIILSMKLINLNTYKMMLEFGMK